MAYYNFICHFDCSNRLVLFFDEWKNPFAIKIDKNSAELTKLTNDLLVLQSKYARATKTEEKIKYVEKMKEISSKRRLIVEKEIENNTGILNSTYINKERKNDFPEEIKQDIEDEIDDEGVFVIVHADDFINNISNYESTFMNKNRESFKVSLPKGASIKSGEKIRIKAVKIKNKMAIMNAEKDESIVIPPPEIIVEKQQPPLEIIDFENFPMLSGPPFILFLDFDGANIPYWNGHFIGNIPPYSIDDDPAFSDEERANINLIVEGVKEKFSPFGIEVTTIDPKAYDANGVLRVVIGGNNAWAGGGNSEALLALIVIQ